MPEHKTIRDYLDTVEEQIRWKRARPVVLRELEQHLMDQRDAFWDEEHPLREAERLAVEEMGDPVSVGTELDRIHRPKPQWGLLVLTMLLALTCCVLKVWLTADWREYESIDPIRTAMAFLLGSAGMLAVYFLDYTWFVRRAVWMYAAALVVGLFTMKIPPYTYGVSYYSRYAVLIFPVGYAFWLYFCRGMGWKGLCLAVLGGVPMALVCLIVPSMTGLMLLLISGLVLLLWTVWKGWFGETARWKKAAVLLAITLACVGMMAAMLFERYYMMARLLSVLHPEIDPLGRGYAPLAVRRALAGARWWGEGAGSIYEGYTFFEWLPGAEFDCLPVSLINYLGWGPFILLALALTVLLCWVLHRALRQKSHAGRVLVLAVVLTLGIQTVFSLLWNAGFMLFNAHFPLLVGNVYLVMDMAMIGLALSVFRGDSIVREPAPKEAPPRERRRLRIRLVYEWV